MLKEKRKKSLSIIIVIAMILSFIPTNVFASDFEKQVDLKDGTLGTSYGVEVKPEKNDSVIMKKSIQQIGTDEFDITLKVSTLEEVTKNFTSPDAAVVIVIDNSGSMDTKVSGTNDSRLTVAKTAANTFVDNFVKDNMGASRKIAVVQFDTNAKTTLGWKEANKNTKEVKDAIKGIKKDSYKNNQGTNIEGGLRIANNLLSDNAVSSIKNLYVVMLTDGVPTCYVNNIDFINVDLNSKTEMKGEIGGGTQSNYSDYKDIPEITTSIKSKANNNTKLYTINFGATGEVDDKDVNTWLSSFATQNITADNVSELTNAFKLISENIKKQMQAWLITDPMGEFIQFDEKANEKENVNYNPTNKAVLTYNRDKKELVWDLKSETKRVDKTSVGDDKTRTTYTLTYRIKLDTSDPNFKEKVSYDTNGVTTLSYVLATTKDDVTVLGELKNANFDVPRVQGTIPSYPYTVEFYMADKASKDSNNNYTYNKVEKDTIKGDPVKLRTNITMDSIDKDYTNKYFKDNYKFATGNTSLQIKSNDNIIKLYYNPILADVLVNHHVTTTVYKADGSTQEKIETPIIARENNLYKGDYYTAKLLGEGYTFIEEGSNPYKNIKLGEGVNTINLYYNHIVDERDPASVKVNHVYTTKSWTLENGKYVLNSSNPVISTPDEFTNLKATSKYTIAPKLEDGFKVVSVEPNTTANTEGNYEVVLNKGLNEFTIQYEKVIENRKETDVTVIHHYKTIKVDETTEETVTDDAVKAYVGENFTATAKVKSEFAQKTPIEQLTQVVKTNGNIINIYYEKDDRVTATIKVNHHYSVTENKLITVIEDGKEVVKSEWVTTGSGIVAVDVEGTYFVGSKYTPIEVTNPNFDEYNYTVESGDTGEQVLSNQSNVFDIYYNIVLEDKLEDAELSVKHVYETWKTFVDEDGKIVQDKIIEDSVSSETIKGKTGETVNITVKETGNYKRYDNNGLSLKLDGTSEIVLKYRQYVNELGNKVAIEVKPYYVTYTKSINDNGETIITQSIEEGMAKTYQELYAGQYFNAPLNDFFRIGFNFDSKLTTDVYSNIKLQKDNGTISLYFSIDNDAREKAIINVKHNYKFTTFKIEDGKRVGEVATGFIQEGIAENYFVGEKFTTSSNESLLLPLVVKFIEAKPGFEVKLISGINEINLYYEGEKDLTTPATVKVNHFYKTIDLNGTITESNDLGIAVNSYAGVKFTATPDLKGTENLETPFEVKNLSDLTVVLKEGENTVNIYYERTIDSRKAAVVKVIHKYYGYDTRIDPAKTNKIVEGTFEESFTTVEEGAWIGNQFVASLRTTVDEGEKTVQYVLDPEDQAKSIKVNEDGNEIVLVYSRDYASPEPPTPPTPEQPDPEEPDRPDPEKPVPSEPEEPVQPDIEEPEIIDDEEIPGGSIADDIVEDVEDIEDEDIPGGAAELPNTGGLPSDIFYGLGALAIMTGVLSKFRRKENDI